MTQPLVVEDGVGVPVGPGQQVLHPAGGWVAEELGQLPTVLPLGLAEQARMYHTARQRGSAGVKRGAIRSATTSTSVTHRRT